MFKKVELSNINLLDSVMKIVVVLAYIIDNFNKEGLFSYIEALKSKNRVLETNETDDEDLDKAIKNAGFCYDPVEDIFYSEINPWQRKEGYCNMYDKSAAGLGMIVDAEPIYFNYGGKKWLIEFWKGQYDLSTGGEIGIYTADNDLNNIIRTDELFYNAVSDEDLLEMSFELIKSGKVMFKREGKHWWLTGFKVGEYSEPSELVMNMKITLKDEKMKSAFILGLRKAGYSNKEIKIDRNTISLVFEKPHSIQPKSRLKETDNIIQAKNRLLCASYLVITSPYTTFPDRMKALKERAPVLYNLIVRTFAGKKAYSAYKEIQKNYN